MIIRVILRSGFTPIGWSMFLERNRSPFLIVILFAITLAGVVAVLFPKYTDVVAKCDRKTNAMSLRLQALRGMGQRAQHAILCDDSLSGPEDSLFPLGAPHDVVL